MNPVKIIFKIAVVGAVSFGAVFFLNQTALDKASRPVKIVEPDNYTDAIKKQIEFDDTVEITGTPNLLNQVSQEEQTEGTGSSRSIEYYYIGLKEYGYDFVIRILPGKLKAELQTFSGRVTGLASTEFGTRIKNSLNKPIDFEESINEEASSELDDVSKEQIEEKSTANFTNATLLLLDGEIVEYNQVLFNVIFWTIILTVFLVTLLRKRVFELG